MSKSSHGMKRGPHVYILNFAELWGQARTRTTRAPARALHGLTGAGGSARGGRQACRAVDWIVGSISAPKLLFACLGHRGLGERAQESGLATGTGRRTGEWLSKGKQAWAEPDQQLSWICLLVLGAIRHKGRRWALVLVRALPLRHRVLRTNCRGVIFRGCRKCNSLTWRRLIGSPVQRAALGASLADRC